MKLFDDVRERTCPGSGLLPCPSCSRLREIVAGSSVSEDWASSWRRIHAGPGAALAGRKTLESATREIKDCVNMVVIERFV